MDNPNKVRELRPRERKRACKWFNYSKDEHGAVILYLLLDARKRISQVLGVSYTLYSVKNYLNTRFGEGCSHPYGWVAEVDESEIYVVTFKSGKRKMQGKLNRVIRRFLIGEPSPECLAQQERKNACRELEKKRTKQRSLYPWHTTGEMPLTNRPMVTSRYGV
jgi:hypothetical protein